MKEKLEAELKDLANKIINSTSPTADSLKKKAQELYEKLTILSFTEENLGAFSKENSPELTEAVPVEQFSSLDKTTLEQEKDEYLPDGTEYNDSEAITEPNTEKIKDIVAQMPPETDRLDFMVNHIISKDHNPPAQAEIEPEDRKEQDRDFRDIGVDYDKLPDFEPIKKQTEKQRPKSLNDRLKKGFNIGLNERLAFIRHLFEGNSTDYNRVISQLNTFDSLEEAQKFIQLVVKPDYKHWSGKEEFEHKFMELVENKFRQ